MAATPASVVRSDQAIRVKGTTLFKQAWNRNRRHIAPSRGNVRPRHAISARRTVPAISVRAAISVTGGMVSTPILMKV